jgi:hypothetical protein
MPAKARVKKTDLQILAALLDGDVRRKLSDADETAFDSMRDRLITGKQVNLSSKQREWVERRYFDLELDSAEGATNDISSGVVKPAKGPMNDSFFGPMVLKPPPRKVG